MPSTSRFSISIVSITALLAIAAQAPAQQPGSQNPKLDELIKIDRPMRELFNAGKYAEALPLTKQVVAGWEQISGPNSKQVANSLLWQAQSEGHLGRYDDAEKTYLRALKINVALYGRDHPESIGCLAGLADISGCQGKYADAEMLCRMVIAIYEKMPNRDERNYARNFDNLGVILQALDKLEEAESVHRRALAITAKAVGTNDHDYAVVLNNLAQVYQRKAKYLEALELYEQALAINEKTLPADHPDLATSLTNLASAYGAIHQFDEAKRFERRSLAIREKVLPADHPETAKSYNNLAVYYFGAGDFVEAEKLYRRALASYEKSLSADHPYLATALQNVATAVQEQGNFAEAVALYDRALAIEKKAFGDSHSSVATTLQNKSSALASLGRWRETADTIDAERRIRRRHIASVLPNLSAKQQMIYLVFEDYDCRMTGLSLGLQHRDLPGLPAMSANWLLNGKGLAQEATAHNALLARDSSDPKVAEDAQKLAEVQRQLAEMSVAPSDAGADATAQSARREQIEQLKKTERELTERVAAATGQNRVGGRWAEVEEVRKLIPEDGVLIEIAQFYEMDFETKVRAETWKPLRYAAWIIPPAGRGDIKIVDLGLAKPIDEAVQLVRKTMNDGQRLGAASDANRGQAERDAERVIKQQLADLAKLVWQPIANELGEETKQLLLSPDGSLWLAPWCALPIESGQYLVEKYPIRYLVSGRDLISQQSSDKTPNPPIIFADPNFDLGLSDIESATRAVLRGAKIATNEALRALGPVRSLSNLPKVGRLKGTAEEASAIKPALAEFARQEPVAYLERYASEGVFKAIKRPHVLVLSTHGFFLPERTQKSDAGDTTTENGIKVHIPLWLRFDDTAIETPLLRCGLLLAGCNQRPADHNNASAADREDGILTGMEIIGVDLRGTEMVVLSACETGLGEVQNGEGVSGLRQAFQLAGAKSVVATLWQIPDAETATLMTSFFTNLAAGQSKAEALRSAQLELIRQHRRKHDAAHPYFWAAFSVTGE